MVFTDKLVEGTTPTSSSRRRASPPEDLESSNGDSSEGGLIRRTRRRIEPAAEGNTVVTPAGAQASVRSVPLLEGAAPREGLEPIARENRVAERSAIERELAQWHHPGKEPAAEASDARPRLTTSAVQNVYVLPDCNIGPFRDLLRCDASDYPVYREYLDFITFPALKEALAALSATQAQHLRSQFTVFA
ncbi:uncharacterized protein [Rutidosis leptorrhynchoides]|uniref:uncharacterized protein n=1 Tax=Rutidosis leptorrhynchoides TaxID=125765 RepID=UPI003A98F3DC